jgi:hypothetical protein
VANGVLRVVGSADTEAQVRQSNAARAQAMLPPASELTGLAGFITDQFILMRRHRDNTVAGWSQRLLRALRAFNGVYENDTLEEIKKFGGSQVYARIVAVKCRGTTSLLRDVYLGPERPWGLEPNPDPTVPPEIIESIQQLVGSEIQGAVQAHIQAIHLQNAHQAGMQALHEQNAEQPAVAHAQAPSPPPPPPPLPDSNSIRDRILELETAARDAAKRNAAKKATIAEDKIQAILAEGGFYNALAEFLIDLPIFPYAVIKGAEVRIKTSVEWVTPGATNGGATNGGATNGGATNGGATNGGATNTPKPITINKPILCWERVSPFDIYWTPGVSDIADANIVERTRVTRKELNDLLDLPGYDQQAVRAVLDDYGRGGLVDNWDLTDAERAILESRENPRFNQSGLIACLKFSGWVQGRHLLDAGIPAQLISDPTRDYFIEGYLIGRYVIKVQLSPSPRKRHQYYISSFEKIPGTIVGNGLPDLLTDIATVANATLRALVNNLSIASGPQVVVSDDRLADGEDGEDLYPWKRWHVKSDPFGNNAQPAITFWQPQANSQELMSVYTAFSSLADEMSAIPKFVQGIASGPTGRTASGLAMLMQNASKILQTVAANIDRDVIKGLLENLLDMIMLTDTTGLLDGQEEVRVLGVNVAMAKEAQLQKELEFLQITANPIDMSIIGPKGRAVVLKQVADHLNIPGADIVPSAEELDNQQKMQAAAQQGAQMGQQANMVTQQAGAGATAARQAQGQQAPRPGGGPRMNTMAPIKQGPPSGTGPNVQGMTTPQAGGD